MLYIVIRLINLLQLAIIIKALLSWIPYNQSLKGVYNFLEAVTKPIFDVAYKVTKNKLIYNGIDFTPLLAYFVLHLLKIFLYRIF